eukprot:9036393-Pyramimonas_sp.AAC.2
MVTSVRYGAANTKPPSLRRNHQTGIVRDVTKTIAKFGGSVTQSKSMELVGLQVRANVIQPAAQRQSPRFMGESSAFSSAEVSSFYSSNTTELIVLHAWWQPTLQFVYMAAVYVGDREKADVLRMTLNDMRVNATWIPTDTTTATVSTLLEVSTCYLEDHSMLPAAS